MSTAERLIEEGKQKGIQEGLLLGKQEGSMNSKIEIARKMLIKGEDINKISAFTGLEVKEIKGLKQN